MSSHPERQDWDDNRVLLTIEEDDYSAYCSPDATGSVFVDEEKISDAIQQSAPFQFDIVFHDRLPREGEVEELVEELKPRFEKKFDKKVDAVYERIEKMAEEEGDDFLEVLMEKEPQELIPSETQ